MQAQKLKNLEVGELASKTDLLSSSDPISRVIGKMRESPSLEAFVEDGDRTAIVTVRDVLNVKNITTTKLLNVMHFLPRLSPKSPVSEAASFMFENRIRSLPVYDGAEFVGIVTARGFVEQLMKDSVTAKINALMTPSPICVSKADEVSKARRLMLSRKIDQIPLLDETKLFGIITAHAIVFNMIPYNDKLTKGVSNPQRFDVPAEDYSEVEVVTNEIQDSLNKVFKNVTSNNSQYSVITNFDEVQGIVTYRDFMRLLMETGDGGKGSIPMYIIGLPEDPLEAELAREKFTKVVTFLKKSHPEMEEARAIIKSGKTKASKPRYEVQILIRTPKDQLNYSGVGFALADVFDSISAWAKRQVQKDGSRKKRSRADSGQYT